MSKVFKSAEVETIAINFENKSYNCFEEALEAALHESLKLLP